MDQMLVNTAKPQKHTKARIFALLALFFILINSATYFISYYNTRFSIFGIFSIQAWTQSYGEVSILPVGATFTLPTLPVLLLAILTLLPFVLTVIYAFKKSNSAVLLGTVFVLILAASIFSSFLILFYSVMLAAAYFLPTLATATLCVIAIIQAFGGLKKKWGAVAATITLLSLSTISLISMSILNIDELIEDGKALYVITLPAGSLAVILMSIALLLKIKNARSY